MKRLLMCLGLVGSGLIGPSLAAENVVINHSESRIEIDVSATMGSFVGHLANYDAQIDFNESTGTVNSASLAFKFSDVKTGEAKRDQHMNDWQGTEKYPNGRFEMSKLTPRAEGGYTAQGRLQLHGQVQELSFPVNILTQGHSLAIDGDAVINTEQFGLPIVRKFLALRVSPEVTIHFHLQGTTPVAP